MVSQITGQLESGFGTWEPNCGLLDGTSKTPPPGQPQCIRGVVPVDSDKADNDPGSKNLDRALPQGERGTRDKHITAEFIGRFRCVPSCVSAKRFTLEIERVEKLEVLIKDMRPIVRPNSIGGQALVVPHALTPERERLSRDLSLTR
jgi:hypothetical protein